MKLTDSVAVVTGAAHGIGEAMARRFAMEGARLVVLADLDEGKATEVAQSICAAGGNAIAMRCDVAREEEISALVEMARTRGGALDLFCSNAGIMVTGDPMSSDADWNAAWSVNVMAHVYAARAALPIMLDQGSGYFLNTCSAAGLLTSLGAAPYAVSKHAAVAFSEWLAITYGSRGIGVSALCPMVVRSKMIEDAIASGAGDAVTSGGAMLEPELVAGQVVDALHEERFLILTHPETQQFVERKSVHVDRWIGSMRKFAMKKQVEPSNG